MKNKSFFYGALCAILLTGASNAAVVHFTDYDSETAAGFGIQPSSMGFTDGGGDHIGQAALGISTNNPRSGSYSYVVDSETVDNGNGWGGTWSGINTLGTGHPTSSGITTPADAMANGSAATPLSYINVAAGSTFTVSGWVATDATDPATGGVVTAPRLEFHNDVTGAELFRNQPAALGATSLTTSYQQMTHSYTLTAADIAAGVSRVTAVWGTDGQGFGNADGLIFVDDFSFEVDDASFITVVPEPSSALLGILGALGLALRRRR